jgi:hypothetical protein
LNIVTSNAQTSTALKAGGIAVNNTGRIVQCTSTVTITQRLQVGAYVTGNTHEIYTGGIVAENEDGASMVQCTFSGGITASIQFADTIASGGYNGSIYSGFAAGRSNGYINGCSYAGTATDLNPQGTGNGMVQ